MSYYIGNEHDTFPYSAVVYIEAIFSNGLTYTGSGTVVGENDVLTASHVVYNSQAGGLAEEITVYPARDGSDSPFGGYEYDIVNYYEVDQDGDGLIFRSESEYDIALLGFETAFGNDTGWFELDPNCGSGTYNLTGYPGLYADESGVRMIEDFGYATHVVDATVFDVSSLETNPGNSGAPLWTMKGTEASLVGVLSTEVWAAAISGHYSEILGWIEDNDRIQEDAPPGLMSGFDDPGDLKTMNGFRIQGSTFGDVVKNQHSDVKWYKFWDGASKTYYTHDDLQTSGNWISAESLSEIELPNEINNFYVRSWGPNSGLHEWMDFTVSMGSMNSTVGLMDGGIHENKTLSYAQVIDAENLVPQAYLRIYNQEQGEYLDASGDGWIKADELQDHMFASGIARKTIKIWVDTYLAGNGRSGWEDMVINVLEQGLTQAQQQVAVEPSSDVNWSHGLNDTSEQNTKLNLLGCDMPTELSAGMYLVQP